MGTINGNPQSESVGLKRSLRFRDLVLCGIILIQLAAPMPSFGVIYQEARGHVVTAILPAKVLVGDFVIISTNPVGSVIITTVR